MKIWHISDTHGHHGQLPATRKGRANEEVDLIIHTGDATNWYGPQQNLPEMSRFLDWFEQFDVPKIYVAGNHDGAIAGKLVVKEDFEKRGIIYLEESEVEIDGVRFWGSPYTPQFNRWHFMKSRQKLDCYWRYAIPDDVDVVLTHGPPKYVLDLTLDRKNIPEYVGDKSLLNRICGLNEVEGVKPQAHLFGHIHNFKDIRNAGTFRSSDHDMPDTLFSNGSCVTDAVRGQLTSWGNIIEL